jgi:hypothetical protein
MGKALDSRLKIDLGNRTVRCPLRGSSTIYRCMDLSRTGFCGLDDDASYKLPIDDEVYETFDRWMGKCKYCIEVLRDKNNVINSILCKADRVSENK